MIWAKGGTRVIDQRDDRRTLIPITGPTLKSEARAVARGIMRQSIDWCRNDPQDKAGAQDGNNKLIRYEGCASIEGALTNLSKLRVMTQVECVVIINQSGNSKQIVCLLRARNNCGD